MCFYKLSRFAWFVSMTSWELRVSEVPKATYANASRLRALEGAKSAQKVLEGSMTEMQCCFLCIWTLTSGAFLPNFGAKMA